MFSEDEIRALRGSIVYEVGKDEYELFGEYNISRKPNNFVVEKHGTFTVRHFSTLRNAVIWTTLDKRNLIVESNRVVELDIMLTGADTNLEVHKRLADKAKDIEMKLTYIVKLQEDKAKKKQISDELDKFAANTKTWQYKQFSQAAK
jgi:hypothetical protein